MDMNISGSGKFGPGEYKDVRISGSGRSEGLVRCENLHASGSYHGDAVECLEAFRTSGSAKLSGALTAGIIAVCGSFKCEADITVKEKLSASGAFCCEGNMKCGEIKISGAAKVGGDIEAEHAVINGALRCDGLVNAEVLEINIGKGINMQDVGSIGGSQITVRKSEGKIGNGFFAKFFGRKHENGMLKVRDTIEGDEIYLENTIAHRVIGRNVTIGDGCKIEVLQYSETVTISPEAQVGSYEKI